MEHGYDIKNAAHCLRLLYGAIHLARHGEIQVFLDGGAAFHVKAVKRGEWSLDAVKRHAERLFHTFDGEKKGSKLPDRIERAVIGPIVRDVIETTWEETG